MMAVYEAANQRKDNEKGEGMVTADNEDAISEPSKTTREIMTFACILTDI